MKVPFLAPNVVTETQYKFTEASMWLKILN